MPRSVSIPLVCGLFLSCSLSAAIRGTVVDPSGAPVAAALVSVMNRTGVEAQTLTRPDGSFQLPVLPDQDASLVVTAPGFRTQTLPLASVVEVKLAIAPQVDSVRVVGSAIDAAASQQGGSVTVIPAPEIRERNLPLAIDLMRYVPGLAFSQTGATGGLAGLFIRGGYPYFNLVEIDGVPVSAFGGGFDFAHIPAQELERVEIVRGPQSAVYGPYANSGVINFITRQPEPGLQLDVLAEGGTYRERRFGISAGGMLAGFGVSATASRMDTEGPVANSDYRNEGLLLNVARHFARQSLALHANFNANVNGVPGPWGSDPAHTFTGIDTVSRNRNNFSDYLAHDEIDLSERVRQEITGSFFQNNNGFTSPFGFSFNKDQRAQGEARSIVSVARHYVVAVGASEALEEARNTFVTNADFQTFPIRRNDTAVYFENRVQLGARLFLNAGVRGEWIRTGAIPGDGFSRPLFPTQTIARANPKLAAAYVLGQARFHSSFGTGIRPPAGFDLAFTDNPALKPERTRSFDAGVEQTLFHGRLALDKHRCCALAFSPRRTAIHPRRMQTSAGGNVPRHRHSSQQQPSKQS